MIEPAVIVFIVLVVGFLILNSRPAPSGSSTSPPDEAGAIPPSAGARAEDQPATLVVTYTGKQQADAVTNFRTDAERLARIGYHPTAQSWAQGQWGCGAFLVALILAIVLVGILMFIYMLVVKPDGTLTVTYSLRRQAPVDVADETKACPRCAETIKAAARVCRFCGHEFDDVAPVTG